MSEADIVAAVRGMLVVTLLVVGPFLAAAIVSSFIVGLLQAGTRINDLTLSFVPRFAATMAVLYTELPALWTRKALIYRDRLTTRVGSTGYGRG